MGDAKFSVLHWHLADDDSFGMQLTSYPDVTLNGAFSEDRVYSLADVEEIVSFA
jgi:hexosaminidase